jgi:spore maturation protein SpmA
MLNYIWLALMLLAVVLGGFNDRLKEVSDEAFNAAKTAVMSIALPLVGLSALWLGIMRLAEKAGMIQVLARLLRPVMRWLFPDVPENHPAMGSMLMNIAANMIGLTNAATPLGLRAMTDLERLNRRPGTATNAMCTFLAINTSSVQLLPLTAIGLMAAANSANPTAIVATSLIATGCSTLVGVAAVKLLEKLRVFRLPAPSPAEAPGPPSPPAASPPDATALGPSGKSGGWPWLAAGSAVLAVFFLFLLVRQLQSPASTASSTNLFLRGMDAVSLLAIPFFLAVFPLCAALRGVRVYEEFVEGAREGFEVVIRIIPFLVAILVAVGMFRGAGGVELLGQGLKPMLGWLLFPPELLPLALTRPLSGSASIGLLAELIKTHGPDSLLARMGGTIIGSTETTFYVLAVYFGAVGVKRTRHAVAAGLLADLAGIIAAVIVCRLVFGS